MKYDLSSNGVADFLNDYLLSAETICGNSELASDVCYALICYIATGRVPLEFVKAMLQSDLEDLAKLSLQGGTYAEIIIRIKDFLQGYKID